MQIDATVLSHSYPGSRYLQIAPLAYSWRKSHFQKVYSFDLGLNAARLWRSRCYGRMMQLFLAKVKSESDRDGAHWHLCGGHKIVYQIGRRLVRPSVFGVRFFQRCCLPGRVILSTRTPCCGHASGSGGLTVTAASRGGGGAGHCAASHHHLGGGTSVEAHTRRGSMDRWHAESPADGCAGCLQPPEASTAVVPTLKPCSQYSVRWPCNRCSAAANEHNAALVTLRSGSGGAPRFCGFSGRNVSRPVCERCHACTRAAHPPNSICPPCVPP